MNTWLVESNADVISIFGNIAPQTTVGDAQGAGLSHSDFLGRAARGPLSQGVYLTTAVARAMSQPPVAANPGCASLVPRGHTGISVAE